MVPGTWNLLFSSKSLQTADRTALEDSDTDTDTRDFVHLVSEMQFSQRALRSSGVDGTMLCCLHLFHLCLSRRQIEAPLTGPVAKDKRD